MSSGVNRSRRKFLARYWRDELVAMAAQFARGAEESAEDSEFESFFASYESSYALTLAYPDEILLESARQAGISVEDKDRKEIVKELFRRGRRG